MKKPICLRNETWQFLQEALNKLPQDDLVKLLPQLGYLAPSSVNLFDLIKEKPGSFLVHAGILTRPDLLTSTVVADRNGLEYFIDREAAEGLQSSANAIQLIRLYDKKPFLFSTAQVIEFINETFDQL
jgi:hypothetical protein